MIKIYIEVEYYYINSLFRTLLISLIFRVDLLFILVFFC